MINRIISFYLSNQEINKIKIVFKKNHHKRIKLSNLLHNLISIRIHHSSYSLKYYSQIIINKLIIMM
jgi:hypothetical protein